MGEQFNLAKSKHVIKSFSYYTFICV